MSGMSSTIEIKVIFDPQAHSYGAMKDLAIASFERQFVELMLERFDKNLSSAAKALKMDRKHLYTMCKKYGLR